MEEINKNDHLIAGVDCLLDKPFSMSQLREAIIWVLDRYAEGRPSDLETFGLNAVSHLKPAKKSLR